MNIDTVLWVIALSSLMLLYINFVYFFDWLGLIGWIVSIISPTKISKEIEENRKLRKSSAYKKHRRKWMLRFLIIPIAFTIVYIPISFILQQLIISYFFSIFVTIAVYRQLEKREVAEKTAMIKKVKEEWRKQEEQIDPN